MSDNNGFESPPPFERPGDRVATRIISLVAATAFVVVGVTALAISLHPLDIAGISVGVAFIVFATFAFATMLFLYQQEKTGRPREKQLSPLWFAAVMMAFGAGVGIAMLQAHNYVVVPFMAFLILYPPYHSVRIIIARRREARDGHLPRHAR